MPRKKIDDNHEIEPRKELIEQLLVAAGDDFGNMIPKLKWLPLRRYLQRVLWSLSLTELNKWKNSDSMELLAELSARNEDRETGRQSKPRRSA